MSSVHYEECVHKILKLNIAEGQEKEVCTMLIDCCAMEKMFNRFFVLQAERLCRLNPVYQDNFTESFGVQFNTVHRLETNKLRNIGKFFAHLLYTDAIPWSIWAQVKITEETTTSSSRIFIKVIFQELSEQWGIKKLVDRLREEELKPFFVGLFPKDHPKNVRFAINYFTAIGLGVLTEERRKRETVDMCFFSKKNLQIATSSFLLLVVMPLLLVAMPLVAEKEDIKGGRSASSPFPKTNFLGWRPSRAGWREVASKET
ncbi:unnamed protein product [Durusdinium trenchii]|uniref:MI domain-containing protein n=1 Tax=Durusdinium trenchii TaxID=1381693 RepID=A0ABP0MKX8_9DINO